MNATTDCKSPTLMEWAIPHLTVIAVTIAFSAMLIGAVLPILSRMLFSVPIQISATLVFWLMVPCLVLAIIGFVREHGVIRKEADAAHLDSLGELLAYCAYPRPGTSLLYELEHRAGMHATAIEKLLLQTCTISNTYLRELGIHMLESGVKNTITFDIIGIGAGDGEDLRKLFPNVRLLEAKEKLTTHFNLVKAAGCWFLWFEPHHDDAGSRGYIPSRGAFLVALNDSEDAERRFYSAATSTEKHDFVCP